MLSLKRFDSVCFFVFFPCIWVFSGLFSSSSGRKQIGVMILVSIILSCYRFGSGKKIISNFVENKILWLLFATFIYGVSSYFTIGYSNSNLVSMFFILTFMLFLPKAICTKNNLMWLIVIGSVFVFISAVYFSVILGEGRRGWGINVIPFTTFSAVLAAFSIVLIFFETDRVTRLVYLLCFSLALLSILIGQSRGVFLALLISGLISFLIVFDWKKFSKKYALAAVFLAFSLGAVVYPKVESRIIQTQNEFEKIKDGYYSSSIGLRIKMWSAAIELSKVSPAFGLGKGYMDEFLKMYADTDDPTMKPLVNFKPSHYHMQFLTTLVKRGWVGLVLLLLPMFYICYYFARYKTLGGLLSFSMLMVYVVAGLTDNPFGHGQLTMLFWLNSFYLLNNPEFDQPYKT